MFVIFVFFACFLRRQRGVCAIIKHTELAQGPRAGKGTGTSRGSGTGLFLSVPLRLLFGSSSFTFKSKSRVLDSLAKWTARWAQQDFLVLGDFVSHSDAASSAMRQRSKLRSEAAAGQGGPYWIQVQTPQVGQVTFQCCCWMQKCKCTLYSNYVG